MAVMAANKRKRDDTGKKKKREKNASARLAKRREDWVEYQSHVNDVRKLWFNSNHYRGHIAMQ